MLVAILLLYCLVFESKDDDMDDFTRVTKNYCPTHNPHTLPRPKSLAANISITFITKLINKSTKTCKRTWSHNDFT